MKEVKKVSPALKLNDLVKLTSFPGEKFRVNYIDPSRLVFGVASMPLVRFKPCAIMAVMKKSK